MSQETLGCGKQISETKAGPGTADAQACWDIELSALYARKLGRLIFRLNGRYLPGTRQSLWGMFAESNPGFDIDLSRELTGCPAVKAPVEVRRDLFYYTDQAISLSNRIQDLNQERNACIESGNTARLLNVERMINDLEDRLGRVENKCRELLGKIEPVAKSSIRRRSDEYRRRALDVRNGFLQIVRWLDAQDIMVEDIGLITVLEWFAAHYPEYQPWMDWEFED